MLCCALGIRVATAVCLPTGSRASRLTRAHAIVVPVWRCSSSISSLCRRLDMPPKRSQRATTPQSEHDDDTQYNAASSTVSALHAKPCLCCGREITPRSKWARNWDAIRFCSDQCRTWRSVVPFTITNTVGDDDNGNGCDAELKAEPSLGATMIVHLRSFLEWPSPPAPKGQQVVVRLHLDAWVEAAILRTAHESTRTSLRTLVDVSRALHRDVDECSRYHDVGQITTFLRDHRPGEREMLRRAARRLIVLSYEKLALYKAAPASQRAYYAASHRGLVLTQHNGKTQLRTLSDISHAKGEIELAITKER